jgi:DNA-binding SARP family transcriptional activator
VPSTIVSPQLIAPPFPAPRATDPTLDIALLGTFGLRRTGDPAEIRLPDQAIRLLAFLLLGRGRSLLREHVAFTLWPDGDETGARANLRRKLHLLVRALPVVSTPWIVSTPTTVGWNEAAPYRLDVAAFESLCTGGSGADADACYTGDLLAGFDDDWIVRERDRLRTLATDNLTAFAARYRQRRDYAGAIRCARRLRRIDPWREDGVRTLIALRFEAGDRAGALAEYERFRTELAAEMGVAPMPETVCVYERVLAQKDDCGPGVPAGGGAAPPALTTTVGAAGELPFVARSRELAALRAAWQRAADGCGGALLVVGEAGIGKTRLIDEFAAFAGANGGRVLRGGTTPFERDPYQAFSGALRAALPLLRDARIEPRRLAVLATLVPQLQVAQPELRRATPLKAEPERTQLFEAVEAALGALCAARPAIIVLEDLHWAGAATVALFEHIARRAGAQRLLVIASYREDDLSRAHPLRATRRRLEREGLLAVTALGPLDTPAIKEIVAQLTVAPPAQRRALAEYLRGASDGNPCLLGEVVANARESGAFDAGRRTWNVPAAAMPSPALSATLRARLGRLSPAARAVAEIAAIAGRGFSAELVCEVSGIGERATLDSLEELIERRLIRSAGGPSGDYVFAHHLIVAAIEAELTPAARRRHHRHVGNVMAELYAERIEQYSGELANHLERGGERERAAGFACIAARGALALYGDREVAAPAAS